MNKNRLLIVMTVALVILGGALSWTLVDNHKKAPIVGTWFVQAPDAPFAYHMFVFNADGTMQQANPDAGDTVTSDSDGKGIWQKNGDKIKGKFVEVTANRTSGAFASKGEISFELTVTADKFDGTADARFYDLHNKLQKGPLPTALHGERVTL